MILFILAVIGATQIIIHGMILSPLDNLGYVVLPKRLYRSLFDCFQCLGFWVGLFFGWALMTHDPWLVFAYGCAGSFIADFGECFLRKLDDPEIFRELHR